MRDFRDFEDERDPYLISLSSRIYFARRERESLQKKRSSLSMLVYFNPTDHDRIRQQERHLTELIDALAACAKVYKKPDDETSYFPKPSAENLEEHLHTEIGKYLEKIQGKMRIAEIYLERKDFNTFFLHAVEEVGYISEIIKEITLLFMEAKERKHI